MVFGFDDTVGCAAFTGDVAVGEESLLARLGLFVLERRCRESAVGGGEGSSGPLKWFFFSLLILRDLRLGLLFFATVCLSK